MLRSAYTHLIDANSVFHFLPASSAEIQYNYYPSADPFADLTPDLQSQTIGQNRTLTNLGVRTNYSFVNSVQNIKVGITYEHTLLNERDTLGVVDPTLNAPCLNADGSPDTDPTLTDPGCGGGALQQNPNFIPLLACYDLTRTANLPASDGCPTAKAAEYTYKGNVDIKQLAFYVQDAITLKNWTFNLWGPL